MMNQGSEWGNFLNLMKKWAGTYRWSVPFILLLLVLLYYQPSRWFSEPNSTVILDREGNLLGAKIAGDDQWRFPEDDQVPDKFKKAILCSEDRFFWFHPGFNPFSLGRAAYQYLKNGKVISGGSTLSMQVIRLSRKNRQRTVGEKLIEIIQSFRLELTHSKKEILTLYASHAPFGGNVVGLDAAAWRYFGIPAESLSWSETATLAVLPNSPSLIFPGKNQPKLRARRNLLLDKLCRRGIIDQGTCNLAKQEPLPGKPFSLPRLAPHLTERASKEGFSGNRIITTLQKDLQQKVNELLMYHAATFRANEIHNTAAMVLDVATGEVLAYAGNLPSRGSAGEGNEVDIITSPRSTGSILKPFLYASSLNDGLILPGMLIPDIPMQIGGFIPENYSLTYDGAVPAKTALARSLNIPAVKMLQTYGYDQFYGQLRRLGMTTLVKPADHYGLSLILGGAEVCLWDLAGMYASMARTLNHYTISGKYNKADYHQPVYIKSASLECKEFMENTSRLDAASIFLTFEAMIEVVRPEEELQWQMFSSSQKVAWKTGTSFGNRDAWAVGVTPDYVVAVWVGNASGEGRPDLTGVGMAAPVLFDMMNLLPSSEWFKKPFQDMVFVPVCRNSGYRASAICEEKDTIWIPKKGLRSAVCPYHRLVHLDPTSTWQVTSACESPGNMIHTHWFILPPVMEWYFKTKNPFYRVLPPFKPGCGSPEEQAMEMIYPKNNSRLFIPVDLDGKSGSVVFHLAHRNPKQLVYWHLDEAFIGTTAGDHQMALAPGKGHHQLTLSDEAGETLIIGFDILNK